MTTNTNAQDFAPVSVGKKSYALSDSTSQQIFDENITQQELAHLKDAGHLDDGVQPIAVVLAGQTGAGKSRLAPGFLSALESRNPAHLIADVYKTYHPEYTTILNRTPSLASPATGADARKWLAMACNWCIDRKVDVLLESAVRNSEEFKSLVSAFHDGGYRVFVAIMAVPECLSLLGIMIRYYKRLPEAQSGGLPLRLTPRSVHYETYDGLLTAADFIDNSPTADDVIVVRRNNFVAYQNHRGPDGLLVRPAAALNSLDLERTRPLLEAEHASYFAETQWLDEHAAKDDVAAARLEDVDASLAALNSTGGRMSSSFPALKPLDVEQWLFGK